DSNFVNKYAAEAGRYLKQSGVKLRTDREFVNRAFVLDAVFRDLMAQEKTDAMTINACLGTIMTVSKTTACLPLSLINDDDGLAFCESDFVVIPSGVLLHYISGLPVFLNDPTYPHDDMITLAHCTAPRKMDGKRYEPALIMTHFESDYGAAPKVEMRVGQRCTCLVPDFASKRWIGLSGKIIKNPFLDICRSQIDIKIDGDQTELARQMGGFHWMFCYNDYLKEVQYALQKVGINFLNLSSKQKA
ncbi:MAG TPA: sugar isomerase, partial [Verrucomicrobiota bacterium]|nr:sugar isomerase [Verrucomicrobiota bacterium]